MVRVMSDGGADGEAGFGAGPDWAEQPRQTSKRTRKARRTIISRNHLNMRKPLDYLMARESRGRVRTVLRVRRSLPGLRRRRRGKPRLRRAIFSGCVRAQLFGSQQLIHRAGAESLQVEGNELESQSFEHGGEVARPSRRSRRGEALRAQSRHAPFLHDGARGIAGSPWPAARLRRARSRSALRA